YIMCSGLGGCSNNVTLFGPTAAAQIANFASSAACMPPPPTVPVLSSVSPGSVTVFAPGAVTLTGSGFYDVTSYTVGGQVLTTGMTILSDTAMAVTMPPTVTLGPTTVSVTGSLGTSNALAVDYVVTQPPKLRSTTLVPATGGIATFDFGGTPNNLWFLVLGIFPTTTPFQGFDLLSNPLLLNNGVFSGPLGIESFSVPVPGGLGQLQFYLQLLEGDTNGMATGVSNLSVTILL
ncbi:MAG: IPT/TIG domain-containing protein, partial [Planctomycetes bacterium]|nr:IPT/TIG domain-containing protein [Planctomycetota bacterium]